MLSGTRKQARALWNALAPFSRIPIANRLADKRTETSTSGGKTLHSVNVFRTSTLGRVEVLPAVIELNGYRVARFLIIGNARVAAQILVLFHAPHAQRM